MLVMIVKGIALLTNFLNPGLKDLSNSKTKVIECLIEWRKQKYNVKARTGGKKKFNKIMDKKSIIIINLKSALLLFEIYKDDKKLRHKITIKNSLLKNSASNKLKLRILNISLVSSLFNNNGAIITVDPFKKNKHSDMKNFFLKKNTVSSFPKW